MSGNASWSRRGLLRVAGAMGFGSWLGGSAQEQALHAAESAAAGTAGQAVLREESRETPVVADCDVCVIGGSCTGVFAAVAAARLGARVTLVENQGFFGGVATAGLVNIWHSLCDTAETLPIIAGLTLEVIDRLKKRDAVATQRGGNRNYFVLNTAELVLELDTLVSEAKVRPFLHARFAAPVVQDGRVVAAVIEDKTGRRAIRAKVFIDATGDGDLVARAGMAVRKGSSLQPPTTCAILLGLDAVAKQNKGFNLAKAVANTEFPEALVGSFLWDSIVPGVPGARMVAGTRVHGADCSDADQLTRAELEGRRQVRAICDIVRKHFAGGDALKLLALPAQIGIRESRHAVCLHTLTEEEVVRGRRFPDAIGNGSYPIDIHPSDRGGITFRFLQGATFYQIPFSSLVPRDTKNVLVAGRLIDADRGAFGAVRVMVNCNQTGQAAGTAAYLALQEGIDVSKVAPEKIRASLQNQGAKIL